MCPARPQGEPESRDRSWLIVSRWQEYEGEARANVLRLISIGLFYAVEVVNYHGLSLGPIQMPRIVDRPFHVTMTALALAWTISSVAVWFCLRSRMLPASLKYVSSAVDILLLTLVVGVADGPRSPLLVGYFVLLALSTLRVDLRLVRFMTVGAVIGYLVVLGMAMQHPERGLSVPRHHQVIMILALTLSGVIAGQVIRRVRSIAEEFADRQAAGQEGSR